MAFAATSDAVDVYMMPAELLLAFTTNRMDERYNPFIRFQANRQFNKYCWMIGDQAVSWEMLPQLAKELFGDLVNVASGHMNEKELFDLPPEEPMPLEPVIATVDTGAVFAQTEPTRPAPGPALYSSSLLSHDFLLSCQSFAVVLDAQLQALAASKTASVNDLSTTINCRQLTTDLTALKMQLLATMAKLKSASDGRAAA